jgi:hypothetical protein
MAFWHDIYDVTYEPRGVWVTCEVLGDEKRTKRGLSIWLGQVTKIFKDFFVRVIHNRSI